MSVEDVARKYLGIKEIGNNRGFLLKSADQNGFEATMRNLGWVPGEPWCAFFAKLVIQEALGPKVAKPLSGGVLLSYNNVKNDPTWEYSKKPLPGGLVFWSTTEGHGHTGIVISEEGVTFHTIEGNTNLKGARDGDGIMVQVRPVIVSNKSWTLMGFARPITNENTQASVQSGQ
jgi:hypothetical protein